MNKQRMLMDDQAEMQALFEEYVLCLDCTTAEKGAAWLDVLEEAERVGRPWATQRLADYRTSGAVADAKRLGKGLRRGLYKTDDGEVRSLTTLRGTLARNESGEVFHQQTLLGEMTKQELDDHIRLLADQRDHLSDRLPSLRRLQAVYERHEGAPTLDAACAAEGITVDAVLLDEVAA